MTTHRILLQRSPQELLFPVKKCFYALGNPIVLVLSQEICQEESMKSKDRKRDQRLHVEKGHVLFR